jgi:hypothetical protein
MATFDAGSHVPAGAHVKTALTQQPTQQSDYSQGAIATTAGNHDVDVRNRFLSFRIH